MTIYSHRSVSSLPKTPQAFNGVGSALKQAYGQGAWQTSSASRGMRTFWSTKAPFQQAHKDGQAIPEIRQIHSRPDGQYEYSRSRYNSLGGSSGSSGSSHFPEARSLAPSPLASTRTRHSPSSNSQSSHGSQESRQERHQHTSQVGHHSAPLSYSYYSRSRGSYNASPISTSPSGTVNPIVLPALRQSTTGASASAERSYYNNQGNPSMAYGNGNGNGSYLHQSRPAISNQPSPYDYYSHRRNPSPPRQMVNPSYGSVPQDYMYSTSSYYDRSPFSGGENGNYPTSFDAISDHGDGKKTRRRGNLPKAVTDTLRVWFTEHIAHPYPTEEEKQILMAKTGLTISQVSRVLQPSPSRAPC